MIIGVFSPLAKIFQPRFEVSEEWDEEERKEKAIQLGVGNVPKFKTYFLTTRDLMKDPARIFKEEKFSVVVERSVGAVKFVYGQPRNLNDPDLTLWLSGGKNGDLSAETDYSGLAEIPLEQDAIGTLVAQLGGMETTNQDTLKEQVAASRLRAKEISNTRVDRQIRNVVNFLKRQREVNKEEARGNYTPSPVEFLCAYYMSAEDAKNEEQLKEINDKFAAMMETIEKQAPI